MKRDLTKFFIDEIYSSPPRKNYETNKVICNHIDEIWSIDLADMTDYKNSNNKRFRYIFVIIDKYSNFLWAIPLKNKYSQTIRNEISKFLTTSKRKRLKLESDRGTDFYNSILQNFLRNKKIQQYSRYTDKSPSNAERVIKTIRNLLMKRVFEKGKADWLSELPSVIKQYNNTTHHSTKMTPVQASRKANEKLVYSNIQDKRRKFNPKCKLGQLVRTADIKRVFSKGDSTNYSYALYTITEVIHDTIPSYRIDYLPERYNENPLLPTKLTHEKKQSSFEEIKFNLIIKNLINGIKKR